MNHRAHPIAALVLCPIEGAIGSRETGLEILPSGLRHGDADADGDREPVLPVADVGGGNGRAQSFGDGKRLLSIGIDEQHREFLAAQTRHEIVRPQGAPADVGDPAQDQIAGGMAVAIVDLFEMIEIEQQQGHPLVVATGALQQSAAAVEELPAVGELGELVDGGEPAEVAFDLLEVGDLGLQQHGVAIR